MKQVQFYRPSSGQIIQITDHRYQDKIYFRIFRLTFSCLEHGIVSTEQFLPDDPDYYSRSGITFYPIKSDDLLFSFDVVMISINTSDGDFKQNNQYQMQILHKFVSDKIRKLSNEFVASHNDTCPFFPMTAILYSYRGMIDKTFSGMTGIQLFEINSLSTIPFTPKSKDKFIDDKVLSAKIYSIFELVYMNPDMISSEKIHSKFRTSFDTDLNPIVVIDYK